MPELIKEMGNVREGCLWWCTDNVQTVGVCCKVSAPLLCNPLCDARCGTFTIHSNWSKCKTCLLWASACTCMYENFPARTCIINIHIWLKNINLNNFVCFTQRSQSARLAHGRFYVHTAPFICLFVCMCAYVCSHFWIRKHLHRSLRLWLWGLPVHARDCIQHNPYLAYHRAGLVSYATMFEIAISNWNYPLPLSLLSRQDLDRAY